MPIGFLIGMCIGFMLCGWSILSQGKHHHSQTTRNNVACTMLIVSTFALIGTIIELIVR